MTQTATVNYHVHKPQRQAFELDAGDIVGNLISPELAPTTVNVLDERTQSTKTRFDTDSVGFTSFPTSVNDFAVEGRWKPSYDAELTTLLGEEVGAKEVVVFDHTVRVDDPDAARKPARNVHSDYSSDGAEQRLIDILGADKAAQTKRRSGAQVDTRSSMSGVRSRL